MERTIDTLNATQKLWVGLVNFYKTLFTFQTLKAIFKSS
jgi:hypothetical protein